MYKILSVLLFLILADYCCPTRRVDNICSTLHVKRVFLRLGESGILTAYNITNDVSGNGSYYKSCQIEIVTCPSCIISLTFRLMNLRCYCGSEFNLFFYNPCGCDYVWVTEPPYGSASGISFCKIFPGPERRPVGLGYKSKTKILRVSLFYNRPHVQAFTAEYKSEQNRQVFFGISQYPFELNSSSGFISSPFFPATYPRDLTSEYVLTCIRKANLSSWGMDVPVQNDRHCRVHLLFTDFQLASSSFVEFYEGNHRTNVVSGISFRPPIIVSATNSLSIRFYASGRSSIGFKAVFTFVSRTLVEKTAMASTDCGGNVDDFGGTIAMMNMVSSHTKLFDCIWLIKPLKNSFNVKSHLYLKVTEFLDFAGDAELQIREGLTSESPMVEKIRYPVTLNFQEHIISFKSGYYVGLRALFGPESHFSITYSAFNQNKCLMSSEFLCNNFRCISIELTCDGFDHCGDNSDELGVCFQKGSLEHEMGRWLARTPNYYFPKIKQYSGFKMASVVFLISLVGLIFFISALIIALFRIRSKIRQERDLQGQMQNTESTSDEVSIEDILIDNPPRYEPPPNYEEVIKSASQCANFDDSDLNLVNQ